MWSVAGGSASSRDRCPQNYSRSSCCSVDTGKVYGRAESGPQTHLCEKFLVCSSSFSQYIPGPCPPARGQNRLGKGRGGREDI